MIKKIIICLLLLFPVFNISASSKDPSVIVMTDFLQPYAASDGVPMDSPFYKPFTKGWASFSYGTRNTDAYTSYMTVATGGIRDIPWNEQIANGDYEITISLTINSPAGLNFVSLSNPHISRPFELYVVMKHSSVKQYDSAWKKPDYSWQDPKPSKNPVWEDEIKDNTDTYSYPEPVETAVNGIKNFEIAKFDKSGQTISATFPFRPLNDNEAKYLTSYNTQMNPKGSQKVWFDMCLILPGKDPSTTCLTLVDKDNYITYENGKKQLLVKADDYSAVVTVDMDITSTFPGFVPVHKSMALPLNGIYDGSRKPTPNPEGTLQLSILPTSACNNLDLMNQQGQYIKIADITLNAALTAKAYTGKNVPEQKKSKREKAGGTTTETKTPTTKPAYVFVSSSPNAFVAGDEFVLKHQKAPEYGEYNIRNHMKYTVMLYQKDKTEYYTYDGTMALDSSKACSNYLMGTPAENGKPANMNKLAATDEETSSLYFKDQYAYQTLTAELGLIMEDKQGLAMIKGAYTSRIYVHVVTD